MADTMREKLIELLKTIPQVNHAEAYVHGMDYVFGCAADYLIANYVTVQQWIPVTERLPELDVYVLAFNGDYIFVSKYFRSFFGSWDKEGHMVWMKEQYAKKPTHWMPLPEPPKEE